MTRPTWLMSPDASLDQLEAQLTAARSHLAEAEATVATRRLDFDLDPSDRNESALKKALEGEASARLHVARAERLIESGREREREAEVAAMHARLAQLRTELDRRNQAAADEPLADREVELIVALAKVRHERIQLRRSFAARYSEAESIAATLGLPRGVITEFDDDLEEVARIAPAFADEATCGDALAVVARLRERALLEDDETRNLIRALEPDDTSYTTAPRPQVVPYRPQPRAS